MILSDMCPAITGITTKDAALSCELGKRALSLAVSRTKLPGSDDKVNGEDFLDSSEPDADEDGILRRGGNLVIKLLESEDNQGEQPHLDANNQIYRLWFAEILILLSYYRICQILQSTFSEGYMDETQSYPILLERDLFGLPRSAVTGAQIEMSSGKLKNVFSFYLMVYNLKVIYNLEVFYLNEVFIC